MIKFIVRTFFLFVLLIPVFIWFSLSPTPLVTQQIELSANDILRAKNIVKSVDPRNVPDGQIQTVQLTQQDLNLALSYLSQQYLHTRTTVNLSNEKLGLQATYSLPIDIGRPYINVAAQFNENQDIPDIESLRIGELNIPQFILSFAADQLFSYLTQTEQWKLSRNIVKSTHFKTGMLQVSYQINRNDINKMRQSIMSSADSEALEFYYQLIVTQTHKIGHAQKISIAEFLPPLFMQASKRSSQDNAHLENQALLMVLGSYMSGSGMSTLVPNHQQYNKPIDIRLRLENRKDFAQHYLISAAIAAAGDAHLSNMIGLYKEIADATKGSGFSFTDLAADRAGTRLGERLTNKNSARQLQQLLANGISEQDIAPKMKDLPEHMSAASFKARYGKVGSPSYQLVDQRIEQRIQNTKLLR